MGNKSNPQPISTLNNFPLTKSNLLHWNNLKFSYKFKVTDGIMNFLSNKHFYWQIWHRICSDYCSIIPDNKHTNPPHVDKQAVTRDTVNMYWLSSWPLQFHHGRNLTCLTSYIWFWNNKSLSCNGYKIKKTEAPRYLYPSPDRLHTGPLKNFV